MKNLTFFPSNIFEKLCRAAKVGSKVRKNCYKKKQQKTKKWALGNPWKSLETLFEKSPDTPKENFDRDQCLRLQVAPSIFYQFQRTSFGNKINFLRLMTN